MSNASMMLSKVEDSLFKISMFSVAGLSASVALAVAIGAPVMYPWF